MTKIKQPTMFAVSFEQIPGGIANGTIIEKCGSEPGDMHPDGARGMIVGGIGEVTGQHGYFIVWKDAPGIAVFVASHRVRRVD